MTTSWAHLPNAAHIDRILASLKANPKVWGTVWDAAWDAAEDAAEDDARDAARDTIRGAARDTIRGAAWGAARGAARDAMAALIAWDDCGVFLDMPPDAVRLVAASGHHPAVLLLPAAIVFSKSSVSFAN